MVSSSEEGEIKYDRSIKFTNLNHTHIIKNKIGEGTFGQVYLSTSQNRTYALKRISTDYPNGLSITTIREIRILKTLNHKNIIEIEDIVCDNISKTFDRTKCDIYIVFPYFKFDLFTLLQKKVFTISETRIVAKQITEGLQYIHKRNFIHRDLKSANILLNDGLNVKICDFGLARYNDKRALTPGVVTVWYRAPELILGCEEYGKAIDIWSLGCIFAEILLGQPFMRGRGEIAQIEAIVYNCGSINEKTYPGVDKLPNFKKINLKQGVNRIYKTFEKYERKFVDVMFRCMDVDPVKRITADEILQMEFFQEIYDLKRTRN